jgi:hypothetical protein
MFVDFNNSSIPNTYEYPSYIVSPLIASALQDMRGYKGRHGITEAYGAAHGDRNPVGLLEETKTN